ncbi:MAG: hypothetical protein H0T85_06905 [Geodermatophilaceae bacterium]|nr:hypothetical protein [Geodermatophilaceae bacterium]
MDTSGWFESNVAPAAQQPEAETPMTDTSPSAVSVPSLQAAKEDVTPTPEALRPPNPPPPPDGRGGPNWSQQPDQQTWAQRPDRPEDRQTWAPPPDQPR